MPKFTFKYGRKDCAERCKGADGVYGFCSPAAETQPNPQGNGNSVTEFFRNNFKLTSRESIALMGAHTFGHPNERISGFRHYPWVPQGQDRLNNEFYKGIVDKGYYRKRKEEKATKNQSCDVERSTFIGDENGDPIHVDWVVRSQWQNKDGGPWNWSPFVRRCDKRICDSIGENNWVSYVTCIEFKCFRACVR